MLEDATKTFACCKCEELKPSTREFFSRGSGGYLMNICKPCDRARLQAFRASHPDYFTSYMMAWHRKDPVAFRAMRRTYMAASPAVKMAQNARRRARKGSAHGSHDAQDIAELFAEQDGACEYCGVYMGRAFTVDHVIPLARGGSNGIDNLVCSCGPCNSAKGAKTGDEFRAVMARRVAA